MKTNWNNAYDIERRAAEIFYWQEKNGWFFDKALAEYHIEFLGSELERLYSVIRPALKFNVVQPYKTSVNKPWNKDGSFNSHVLTYCDKFGVDPAIIGGPFSRVLFEEPNLGSEKQLKEQLYALGWEPTLWNYKKDKSGRIQYDDNREPIRTSPKLTEDSYDSLTIGIGPDVKRWMVYSHRLTNFVGWLRDLRPDGTIPSRVDSCGTPTARVRHRVVTNIPNVESIYGPESREVFIPRPGRILVGEDRAQIEARMIAHVSIQILGHSNLADAILGRDFHQVIFEALEGLCTTRGASKTPEYAFFFGAKAPKLGQSIDNKPSKWSYDKAGKEVLKLMEKNIPGIVEVRDALAKAAEKGYIKGFDGRKLFIRKKHAALNTYTQGNGSICCKTAMIMQQEEAKRQGLDVMQVGYYHDETQNDTLPEHGELFGEIAVKAIKDTGKLYNLMVPLDGTYETGSNWKETHT